MEKTYDLNSANDMIELAREIQTEVYWDTTFHMENDYDTTIRAKDFWDYLIERKDNGITAVRIKFSGSYPISFLREDA